MAHTSLPLPHELILLIAESAQDRHCLWALSLTCRELNTVITPILYDTVVVNIRDDDTFVSPHVRCLVQNLDHPKRRLIRDLAVITGLREFEREVLPTDVSRAQTLIPHEPVDDSKDCNVMGEINQIIYCFLKALEPCQLRGFVWQTIIPMIPQTYNHLAEFQPALEHLRFYNIAMELGDLVPLSHFLRLKSLYWGMIDNLVAVGMLFDYLQTSPSSLRSLCIGATTFLVRRREKSRRTSPVPLTEWGGVETAFSGKFELPGLVEYKSLTHPILLQKILPSKSSHITRLYLRDTSDASLEWGKLLFSFRGLVEIGILYYCVVPSVDMFCHHRDTLKVLSVRGCMASRRHRRYLWSVDELVRLGEECKKLSELTVSNRYRVGLSLEGGLKLLEEALHLAPFFDNGERQQLVEFPIHVFTNLEFLYFSLQREGGHGTSDRDLEGAYTTLLGHEVERVLNTNQFDPAGIKLKIVCAEVGRVIQPLDRATRIYWRAVPPRQPNSLSIGLELVRREEIVASHAGLRLRHFYPSIIFNEGLRTIVQARHLPPLDDYSQ
ncbi:hypothetical protein TWF730_009849 [Orbilia blumenaviensis]|uniref:F-box domain-containing protein n=1 Tax=Orbilia blumenaviensis TaxID=1796055 RepID=A0AAV9UZK2_9PEZI